MTDDLKQQFERLVADAPPPGARPSEAVFARVRTARRRRTAGVTTLAVAAVAGIAVAAGNLTDISSTPPVTNSPSAPSTVITAPPTSTQTSTPSTTTPKTDPVNSTTTVGTTGSPDKPSGTTNTPKTNTPPPERPVTVDIMLKPTVTGRTVSLRVTVSGTVVVPVAEDGRNLSADTSFADLSMGTTIVWGDGQQGGSDPGAVNCSGTTRRSGHQTYTASEPYTYTKPGTYTIRFELRYCAGKNSKWSNTKTVKVTVK
ncbi:hypothetical protein [Kribbella sp. NPDC048915]|uniref:hypothetical protein n=1 Tax=Kribbella sp. NPDC048915 TaxID=3155148 RepID=UPI0033CC0D43